MARALAYAYAVTALPLTPFKLLLVLAQVQLSPVLSMSFSPLRAITRVSMLKFWQEPESTVRMCQRLCDEGPAAIVSVHAMAMIGAWFLRCTAMLMGVSVRCHMKGYLYI